MKNKVKKILVTAVMAISGLFFGLLGNEEKSEAYEISGFYQYEVIDDISVRITKYIGGEVTVNVPSEIAGKTVTEIGYGAFNEGLMTYVNLPDTITYIGSGAFYNCDSLKEIVFPDSVEEINSSDWEDQTFGNCDNLEKVVIGKGVKNIGTDCFRECKRLKTVSINNEAGFNIGAGTFRDCEQLETINIPGTIEEIHFFAFENCISLTNLTLNEGLTYIGRGAFYNCDSLKEIIIPDTVKEINSSDWEDQTFGNCDNLEKVVIGKGVKNIGTDCFRECKRLKTVSINNEARFNIGAGTFRDCKQLETINIPGTVEEIHSFAFKNCSSLSNLTLNEGLTYIGCGTFNNCDSLKEIVLPDSVETIDSDDWGEDEAFGDCDHLETVVIGKNTESIGIWCFRNCAKLQKVIIPKCVTEIGNDIFIDSPKAVIYGFSGSMAQTYAEENEIHFVEMLDIPMTSLSFNVPEIYMMAGENFMSVMQISPVDTTDGIRWQSSDENIAVVNNSGKVTAKQEGSATIIATSTNGMRASYNVVVSKAPEYLNFNVIEKETKVGDTFKNVAIVDDGRTDILVTYKSSDSGVASVDSEGNVEILSEGECNIIAETAGGLTASYKITVQSKKDTGTESNSSVSPKKKLKLSSTKAVIKKGKMIRIKAVATPTAKIKYSSSNKKIAVVNFNGLVKAKRKGKAVIFVKANDITKKFKAIVK